MLNNGTEDKITNCRKAEGGESRGCLTIMKCSVLNIRVSFGKNRSRRRFGQLGLKYRSHRKYIEMFSLFLWKAVTQNRKKIPGMIRCGGDLCLQELGWKGSKARQIVDVTRLFCHVLETNGDAIAATASVRSHVSSRSLVRRLIHSFLYFNIRQIMEYAER